MPDKRLIKTGITGSPHANATSFKKGRSGNPAGRPKGAFRAGSRAAAVLLDARAEALAQQAIEMAFAGDPVAVRFCLGRILGTQRGQPVELALPAVAEPGDLSGAIAAVTAALADGRITPDEALACAQMLDGFPRIFSAVPAPPEASKPDPREALIAELDRLAEREALRQSQALASIPLAPSRNSEEAAEAPNSSMRP